MRVCLVRLELFLKFFLLCLSCPPVLSLVGVEVNPGTGIQSANVSDDGQKVTVTTDNGGEVHTLDHFIMLLLIIHWNGICYMLCARDWSFLKY